MMPSMDQLNAWTLSGASLLLESLGTVCMGWLVSRVATQSAAHRVHLWRLTFGSLLLLPVLEAVAPTVDVALLGVDHAALDRVAAVGGLSTSVGGWLVLLWASGAALTLLRLVRDTSAAHALSSRAIPVRDTRMRALSRSLTSAAGLARIDLKYTAELDSPAMIGWRHPVVLLPLAAANWSTLELRAVLCHEIEHVRSRDWIVMLLERVIGALYWPNPFILLARVASTMDRERTADNAVLRAAVEPQAYATQLLRAARNRTRLHAPMSLAFARHSVEGRVRALFGAPDTRTPVSMRARLTMAALAVPLVLGLSAVRPWTCLPPLDATPASTP
jgi:beta-lactamase regulating signal transducer with metallopeptidase domain